MPLRTRLRYAGARCDEALRVPPPLELSTSFDATAEAKLGLPRRSARSLARAGQRLLELLQPQPLETPSNTSINLSVARCTCKENRVEALGSNRQRQGDAQLKGQGSGRRGARKHGYQDGRVPLTTSSGQSSTPLTLAFCRRASPRIDLAVLCTAELLSHFSS